MTAASTSLGDDQDGPVCCRMFFDVELFETGLKRSGSDSGSLDQALPRFPSDLVGGGEVLVIFQGFRYI